MKNASMLVVMALLLSVAFKVDATETAKRGPEIKLAVYNPANEQPTDEESGSIIIEMNYIGGAYMVLDEYGDLVSMGNATKEIELDPGKYYIIPEQIDYYTARPIVIRIRSGQTEEVMIEYKKDLSDDRGTLLVDLIPPFGAYYIMDVRGEVVAVGFDSEEFELAPGVYFIVPQKLDGFETPKPKGIKILPDGVQRVKVRYKSDGTQINLDDGTVIASL